MSHETQNHNITLESVIIMIDMLLGEGSNVKAVYAFKLFMVRMTRKLCDWIAHLDYYFDLYEFSDACRVHSAK